MSIEELARVIRSSLHLSSPVEIDGLGTFALKGTEISFRGTTQTRVFIAYACEDVIFAEHMYDALEDAGFAPWMDRKKLLPGQNWPRRIEDAIGSSDFFIACFSRRSVNKRGAFQAEIRYALDCARRIPLDEVFLIPVRLDECRVPGRIQRETQYVDMFPDWERGFTRIQQIIEKQILKVA